MAISIDDQKLIEEATIARDNSYSPYSKFKVGAAILTSDGRIFRGCNVENVSYGLSICAERSAVSCGITSGYHNFVAIAIVTDGECITTPCGACRQVLSEFNINMRVIMANTSGLVQVASLSELLPCGFDKF